MLRHRGLHTSNQQTTTNQVGDLTLIEGPQGEERLNFDKNYTRHQAGLVYVRGWTK